MPKKRVKKKKKKQSNFKPQYPLLTSKIKRIAASVLMFVLALIVSFSFFDRARAGNRALFSALNFLIGKVVFAVPLFLVLGAFVFIKPSKKRVFLPIFGALAVLILGTAGLIQCLNTGVKNGGALGYILSLPFIKLFGPLAAAVVFSALIFVSLVVFWEFRPSFLKTKTEFRGKNEEELKKKAQKPQIFKTPKIKKPVFSIEKAQSVVGKQGGKNEEESFKENFKIGSPAQNHFSRLSGGEYKFPPLNLLSKNGGKPLSGDIEYSKEIIKTTLANFGIEVEMGEVNVGPTVTQYTFKPAEGVKLSKITALSNDLSLALAAHPIRIEAPIPGKSLVGVEVPNKTRANVPLADLIADKKFNLFPSPLAFPLGKDVSGNSFFGDLEKMPHLLVAGSTGSGKTIFLQSLIVSLLYRNSPQTLRLILVDPKRVEFPVYSRLPHLLAPVVCRPQKTVNVLNWAVKEMERRFDVLQEAKTRDIKAFNALVSQNKKLKEEKGIMPYIILIIDELADLMAAMGREVEAGIVRISQLARAVGIHLVVATQRPSVDVITGLIKANLTSRVAFQVASQVDSRTILDCAGAENLLGRGDMLYLSPEYGKPKRLQGCYVLAKDVKKVISFIADNNKKALPEAEEEQVGKDLASELEKEPMITESGAGQEDPLYEEAKRVVFDYKRASASLLQRRLKVGYARAARLLDMLEENGIIGPADGAKPREVYIQDTNKNSPTDFLGGSERTQEEDRSGFSA